MKVAIMQPYFFPYVGYFSLMDAADQFVFFDTPQYIRHGWVNRNRILKPSLDDWQYIVVPIRKHQRNISIKEVEISDAFDWKTRLIGQLQHYRKRARYFNEVVEIVERCLAFNTTSLSQFNINATRIICDYLDLDLQSHVFSEMSMEVKEVNGPGDWALEISRKMKAGVYINPMGGKDIFDSYAFAASGIGLFFLENGLRPYIQPKDGFISGLSILDVMMFNEPAEVLDLIRNYRLTK